jgi:hypothetical protein
MDKPHNENNDNVDRIATNGKNRFCNIHPSPFSWTKTRWYTLLLMDTNWLIRRNFLQWEYMKRHYVCQDDYDGKRTGSTLDNGQTPYRLWCSKIATLEFLSSSKKLDDKNFYKTWKKKGMW